MANEISPAGKFYEVSIEVLNEVPGKKGEVKIKKERETHLVDANSPTEVENKVKEEMKGEMYEWKILSIRLSKILVVY